MEQTNTTNSEAGRAGGIIDRVRDRAGAQLSSQKDRATDGLGSIAEAARQSTHHLRDNQHDTIAQYVEKAADQLDRFSTEIRNRDVGELAHEVQRFARRQPALFVGAAFAVGVLGARFLKSSADHSGNGGGLAGYGGPARGLDNAGRRIG